MSEEETFNLSEKIFFDLNCFEKPVNILFTKDVKEFIRLDWKLFMKFLDNEISFLELVNKRMKLAGEDLK